MPYEVPGGACEQTVCDDIDAMNMTQYTVTAAASSPVTVGMWIEFADTRRWWVKVWHWIIRKKIQHRFKVIEPITATSFTVASGDRGKP